MQLQQVHCRINKLLASRFNIDLLAPIVPQTTRKVQKYIKDLFDFIELREFNEAENLLYELLDSEKLNETDKIQLSLLFYLQLSELPMNKFENVGYEPEEVVEGFKEITRRFQLP